MQKAETLKPERAGDSGCGLEADVCDVQLLFALSKRLKPRQTAVQSPICMNKRTAVAITVCIAILMVAGVLWFVFQPPKQVSHRPPRRTTDAAPGPTDLVGVGLVLGNGPGGHTVIIQQVVPNTPAAEAHITGGMIISKVDDVSLEGKPLAGCVSLIRGPAGTTVRLELITPDHTQTNTLDIDPPAFVVAGQMKCPQSEVGKFGLAVTGGVAQPLVVRLYSYVIVLD